MVDASCLSAREIDLFLSGVGCGVVAGQVSTAGFGRQVRTLGVLLGLWGVLVMVMWMLVRLGAIVQE